MAKKANKSRFGFVVVFLLCIGGAAALAYYVKFAPADKIPIEKLSPRFAAKRLKDSQVKVPNPNFTKSGDLEFNGEDRPTTSGTDSRLFAVNEFLAKLESASLRVESVEIDHGVAKINFPAGTKLEFGSTDETTFLLGLRSTMGQFDEVESIQLFLAGQPIEELGHEVFDAPMPVIRPENWKNPTKPASTQYPSE